MGDDGEKFGAWPGTYESCWGAGAWMERFLAAIEANAGWLEVARPSDWLTGHAPQGRIYVPSSSYVEMTEWALPVEEAGTFHDLLANARTDGSPAARFLTGAPW